MGTSEDEAAETSTPAVSAKPGSAMAAGQQDGEGGNSASAAPTPTPAPLEATTHSNHPSRKSTPLPTASSRAGSVKVESSRPTGAHTPASRDATEARDQAADGSESEQEGAKGKSGYGTRSRNRRSNARPNYAEDVEMDFEKTTVAREQASSSDLSLRSSPEANSRENAAAVTKKPAATANGVHAPPNTAPGIPGTSTFSANPNVSVPRKRKAQASQAAGNSGASAQPSQTNTRRSGAFGAAQTLQIRVNNMFSFDRCRATLKNGKLVSDDGTVFAINGMLLAFNRHVESESFILGENVVG